MDQEAQDLEVRALVYKKRDPQAITRGTPREIRLDAVHAARQRCGASGIERTEHETVLVRQRDARRHAQLAEVRWLTRVTSGA
jgi:hypothetical protein